MPKSSVPATELQDAVSGAVAAFMKAASHALALAEESAKEEVRRALQDVRAAQHERDDIRRERDALIQEKLNAAIELESIKGEVERWKTATEKAEWMLNHQTETITQLRREAQQWKDQFIRVDEERLRLSARNDELVSQQLYANRRGAYHQEPLTPRSQGPQGQGSSSTRAASSSQYPSSAYINNGYVTDGDILSQNRALRRQSDVETSSRTRTARKVNNPARPQPIASSSRHVSHSQTGTPGRVLRTVHVVMQGGTVKEESLDSVALESATTRSESIGDEERARQELELETPQPTPPPQQKAAGKRKAAVQSHRTRRRWSEGRRIYDDESESGTASEGEGGSTYVPTRKTRPGQFNEEEDEDELILGGEGDHHETYGSQKTLVSEARTPARRAQTQPTKVTNVSGGAARKRNSPYIPSGAGKKARNR